MVMFYLAIVNDHRAKLFPGLGIVECASGFADLHQQSLPFVEVFTKAVINVLCLHVPQTLVLEPHL